MAQFGNKVKLTVLKGMEAIGQGASNLASNAQQRLQELNLDNQRRELLNAFPLKAYELWQKGESLPQPLEEMLKEFYPKVNTGKMLAFYFKHPIRMWSKTVDSAEHAYRFNKIGKGNFVKGQYTKNKI